MSESIGVPGVEQKKRSGKQKGGYVYKKMDVETAKLFQQFKEKANRKNFGRKVRDFEVLAAAVRLLGAAEVAILQDATYSERDRLEMSHEDYQRQHGRISLDQFIGKLIRGEVVAPRKQIEST